MNDTTPAVAARHRELIAQLTPAERLVRAFELTALARDMAWEGAKRYAGDAGPDAVRRRFLEQMYGPAVARWYAARVAADRPV